MKYGEIPGPTLFTWNQLGPGTFDYETAANWTPSQTPTATTDVLFPLDGDVDVILTSTSVAKDVTFSDGVHRTADDRHVKRDVPREPRTRRHFRRHDLTVGRFEKHVVESESTRCDAVLHGLVPGGVSG